MQANAIDRGADVDYRVRVRSLIFVALVVEGDGRAAESIDRTKVLDREDASALPKRN